MWSQQATRGEQGGNEMWHMDAARNVEWLSSICQVQLFGVSMVVLSMFAYSKN